MVFFLFPLHMQMHLWTTVVGIGCSNGVVALLTYVDKASKRNPFVIFFDHLISFVSDMSILHINNKSNMGSPLHEFKKQASFFLKEKIKTARLVLTDVTPAELLTEEATNGNPWSPDTCTMGVISRAAFEVDDYWRIVEILHKRLSKFDRKNWRVSYNALVLLEHLLTHGPQRVAEEFESHKDVIEEMGNFQYIDEKGFNWGLSVRKLGERILRLLEDETFLKEERARARKLTHEIKGFGSFSQRSSSIDGSFKDSFRPYGRCNSQYNDHGSQENEFLASNQKFTVEEGDFNSGLEKLVEEDHPFCDDERETAASLLSTMR